MRRFTEGRDASTPDEVWFLEHPPVFTLGLNGRREHVLAAGDIPVVRGSWRTGHLSRTGPARGVSADRYEAGSAAYPRPRDLPRRISRIELCAELGIHAEARCDAPGDTSAGRKLASIGLRVRRSCSYHGLALNVCNDLQPFSRINPCGFAGLEVVRLADLSQLQDSAGCRRSAGADPAAATLFLLEQLFEPGAEAVGASTTGRPGLTPNIASSAVRDLSSAV